MLALLTNDDGYASPGLHALWRELDTAYETVVVAPTRGKSWIGKALSNPGALEIETKFLADKQVHVVNDGTPADCTNLGMYHVCARKPDLVVSGINSGANFTSSLALASGTVGAALEAAVNGVLGLAVSLALDAESEARLRDGWNDSHVEFFLPAARAVKIFLREILPALPARAKLVNLIAPMHFAEPPRFFHSAPLPYEYGSVFEKRGETFYNRGRGFLESTAQIVKYSDVWVVREGIFAYTCYTGKLESIEI